VDGEWRGKLCDFSFACHEESTSKRDFIYGTTEFMSPEIALALDFDKSAG
jgi:serine/threonine protein kinase